MLDAGHEEFREVPVLMDRRPSRREGGARLRIEQLVTSVHKNTLKPPETAHALLGIARTGAEDGGGDPVCSQRAVVQLRGGARP